MADNRMWLVHRRTGKIVLLAKLFGITWSPREGLEGRLAALFDDAEHIEQVVDGRRDYGIEYEDGAARAGWIAGPPTGPGCYWIHFPPGTMTSDHDDIEGVHYAELEASGFDCGEVLTLVGFSRREAHVSPAKADHHIPIAVPAPPSGGTADG